MVTNSFDPTNSGATPFDPTQYGATSVSDSFDPMKFGATPVATQSKNFFASQPTGESPYNTGNPLTSRVLPYNPQGEQPPMGNTFGSIFKSSVKNTLDSAGQAVGMLGKAVVNAPTSAVRFGLGFANPMTYVHLGQGLAGGIQSAPVVKQIFDYAVKNSPGGQESLQNNRDAFSSLVTGLQSQYGSLENIKRSFTEDPVQTLLLARGILEGGGHLATKVGATDIGGALSNAGKSVFPVESAVQGGKEIAQGLRTNLQPKAISDLAQTYRDIAGQTQTPTKTLAKSAARGYDDPRFLAERNITPDVVKGKVKTIGTENSGAIDRLNTQVSPLNDAFRRSLETIEPSLPKSSIEDVRTKALENVNKLGGITEVERQTLKNHINEELDLQIERGGNEAGVTRLDDIKKASWQNTPFDSTKPYLSKANYQIGKATQTLIENLVPKDQIAVHELNNEIGKYYSAKKFLESLDGKAVKGGRLGTYSGRILGGIAGHALGGFAGTVLGELGGGAIADILQKNTFSNPLKQLILRDLEVSNPPAYRQAVEFLKKSGQESLNRKLLPSPKYIEGQPYKGGQSRLLSSELAGEKFKQLGTLGTKGSRKLSVENETPKSSNVNIEKPQLDLRPKEAVKLRITEDQPLSRSINQSTPKTAKTSSTIDSTIPQPRLKSNIKK